MRIEENSTAKSITGRDIERQRQSIVVHLMIFRLLTVEQHQQGTLDTRHSLVGNWPGKTTGKTTPAVDNGVGFPRTLSDAMHTRRSPLVWEDHIVGIKISVG